MRSYHVAAVAFATECEPKWIDNLLSHRSVRGATGGQRGVPRRITAEGAIHIALTRVLTSTLGLTIDRALDLSEQLADAQHASLEVGAGVTLTVDTSLIRANVESRLADAIELTMPQRRGRPPGRRDETK